MLELNQISESIDGLDEGELDHENRKAAKKLKKKKEKEESEVTVDEYLSKMFGLKQIAPPFTRMGDKAFDPLVFIANELKKRSKQLKTGKYKMNSP